MEEGALVAVKVIRQHVFVSYIVIYEIIKKKDIIV